MAELIFISSVISIFILSLVSSYKDTIYKNRRKWFLINQPETIKNSLCEDNTNTKSDCIVEQVKSSLVECGFTAKEAKNMISKSSGNTVEEWVKNAIIEANKI